MEHAITDRGFFTSDDLTVLKDVFHEVCDSNGTAEDSPTASRLAKALMAAFDHGIKERDDLILIGSIESSRPAA